MIDEFDSEATTPRRRRTAVFALVGGLLVLIAAYVGAAAWASGRTPSDTKIGGVQVGGQSTAQARSTLEKGIQERVSAPVTLKVGEATATLNPVQAGLTADLDASVEDLTGFSLSPVKIVNQLTGGVTRPLVTQVDTDKLTAAVTAAAKPLAVAAKEGSISVAGGKVAVVQPVKGRTVDVEKTVDAVAESWPRTSPLVAPVNESAPKVTADELARVKTEFADKAMSGPVTVKAGEKSFEVSAKALAPAISFPADANGKVTPKFDDKKIIDAVHDAGEDAEVTVDAKDATVRYRGGQPQVVPARTGLALDESKIVAAVTPALTSADRTATIPVKVTQPKFTTEEAKATLPKGLVSTFTTYFDPNGGGRVTNIRIAARTINGMYIPPGGTFSLNAALGQRTPDKGYEKGGVINGGRLEENYGGGTSQVSTTVFNAAFFAGMKFEEYKPHGFYISRYPEGREATLSWPDLDMRFVNTTDGGIRIVASSTGGQITVAFYGTKKWDITASKSSRSNIVQWKSFTDDSPKCITMNPNVGFDVTVTRTFKQNGATVKTDKFFTRYKPENKVTCTHPDAK
ncbi:vancomycin resistance protein YoaR [Knoellia remsis]|uniref:Vancomycin resistance protein YoaR n=2 Tax=Knoellia remsis TaxID=407159 RepID=A0A2T0UQT9_9MICO|nr:vancomycin resistance protein YoaR [Knoellia remsis]